MSAAAAAAAAHVKAAPAEYEQAALGGLKLNFSLDELAGGDGFEGYADMLNCINWVSFGNGSSAGGEAGLAGGDLGAMCAGIKVDHGEYDVLRYTPYKVLVILLYCAVILLGAVGNTLVVLTVVKTKAMWNATNIFIANLAVADVFVCVLDLPPSAYYQITDDWIFGSALCHVMPMLFAIVVYSSTLTLTLIAVDRYMLIIHPMATRMSVTIALIIIVVIMVISVSAALPIGIFAHYQVYEDPDLHIYRTYCIEAWPDEASRQVYTISLLVLQHFLPLLVIAVLYTRIFCRISKRIPTSSRSSRRTKTTKMLVAVVAVFAVCWTPYHINSILLDAGVHPAPSQYFKFIDAVLRVFAMSSSCINPLLYGWLNDNFRTAFLSIIRRPTATPVGIHNEDSEATRNRLSVAPSPMRKFYRKITNIGGAHSREMKENNNSHTSCCSNGNADSPEGMPLQTVVMERNGQAIVVPTERFLQVPTHHHNGGHHNV